MPGVAIAILLLLSMASAAYAEARIALLIGNQEYNAKVGPLENPHADVALIGAALRSLEFKVTEIKDGDYRSIDAAIKRHVQNVRREGKGTISFFYYSGHGAADPDTKINYLIPIDVANADDEELWTYSLNLNTVVEGLRGQAPGATHYVVFDACRNELNLTRKGRKALTNKGFVPIAYTPGVLVAYATALGGTASDLGTGGGTYAKALAEEIVKPGVDSMLVFARVARRVQREIGQDPFLSSSTMPEFSFAVEKKPMPTGPTPQLNSSDAERTWPLVKDSTDTRALEAFRRQYGKSNPFYDRLAEARIEELKRVQVPTVAPPPSVSPTLPRPATQTRPEVAARPPSEPADSPKKLAPQAETPRLNLKPNSAIVGDMHSTIEARSPEECRSACLRTAECRAFDFKKQCRLYRKVTKETSIPGFVSWTR